jgi:hypothetical protein
LFLGEHAIIKIPRRSIFPQCEVMSSMKTHAMMQMVLVGLILISILIAGCTDYCNYNCAVSNNHPQYPPLGCACPGTTPAATPTGVNVTPTDVGR